MSGPVILRGPPKVEVRLILVTDAVAMDGGIDQRKRAQEKDQQNSCVATRTIHPGEIMQEMDCRAMDSRARPSVQAGPPVPKTVSNFCPFGKEWPFSPSV